MSYDELRSQTELLRSLRGAVEAELKSVSGLRGVGVGIRERAGQPTDELCFRVYVDRKRPLSEVAARDRIPSSLFGHRLDVHTIVRAKRQCCGATRPLLAGLRIGREPFSELTVTGGTLGCFLKLPPDNRFVALTNEHVLLSRLSQDRRVFQPEEKDCAGFTCNLVGLSVPAIGHLGPYTFENEETFIDCAALDLDDVGFVNRFVKFSPSTSGEQSVPLPPGVPGSVKRNDKGLVTELRDETNTVVDTTRILGSAEAVVKTLVWKVGATTGLTVGYIDAVDAPAEFADGPLPVTGQRQIHVKPLAGFQQNGVEFFSQGGDSGSVYMDVHNKVVGLHHHGSVTGFEAIGCRIQPVLKRLSNAVVFDEDTTTTQETAAASTALARELWTDAPAPAHDLSALERELRVRLLQSAQGKELVALLEAHLPEVLRLVWTQRAVTIVWHRHHGPGFVALCARALAAQSPLPSSAGGVTRRALLHAMSDIIVRHASPALRNAVAEVRPWLLELLAEARDANDFLARLERVAA